MIASGEKWVFHPSVGFFFFLRLDFLLYFCTMKNKQIKKKIERLYIGTYFVVPVHLYLCKYVCMCACVCVLAHLLFMIWFFLQFIQSLFPSLDFFTLISFSHH